MPTFDNTYGPDAMMASVSWALKRLQEQEGDALYIHTISLTLNGMHGEFDLTVKASDDTEGFLEEREWTAIAQRYGGVRGNLEEVKV